MKKNRSPVRKVLILYISSNNTATTNRRYVDICLDCTFTYFKNVQKGERKELSRENVQKNNTTTARGNKKRKRKNNEANSEKKERKKASAVEAASTKKLPS